MTDHRLSDLIKSATEVNLRYSATLLNLSKDYVKAFSEAVTKKEEAQQEETQQEHTEESAELQQRVPLIVAGRKGEATSAAFAVNNTSQMDGTVTLEAVGEFGDSKIVIDPKMLSLKTGEGAIIRILATIGKDTPVDVDHPGAVVIPELGLKVSEFVMRRLPDLPPKKKKSQRKPANKN